MTQFTLFGTLQQTTTFYLKNWKNTLPLVSVMGILVFLGNWLMPPLSPETYDESSIHFSSTETTYFTQHD